MAIRMKTGLLERILTRRYGPPISCIRGGLPAKSWNHARPDDEALLYTGMNWKTRLGIRFAQLQDIYGDTLGGFMVTNTLKVAVLAPHRIYGVWRMDELQMQPEVQHALIMDPSIDYFMDEDNVLFYGIKRGHLYVFDSETDELDSLGQIEPALETLMAELESARDDVRRQFEEPTGIE
jgi:hypothetical protein